MSKFPLDTLTTSWDGLQVPAFETIKDADYFSAVETAIDAARGRLSAIIDCADAPSFENTIATLEQIGEEMEVAFSMYHTVLNAESTDLLQEMSQKIEPMAAAFGNDVMLNADLFARVDAVWEKRETLGLDAEQMAVLDKTWHGFVRNGAKLSPDDKEKLRKIDEELAGLSPKFSDNVRKATKEFEYWVEDEAQLSGLPESAVVAAKEAAETKDQKDKWLFTLDFPSLLPVLTYADDRAMRETIWRANVNKGLKDDTDNRGLIKQILKLRHDRAKLLGFATHADYVLERRMAGSKDTVMTFLETLRTAAYPLAKEEMVELQNFVKKEGGPDPLKPWDLTYYSEKLKQAQHNFDEEKLRPYFSLPKVMDGLFDHAKRLFKVELRSVEGVPVYHEDVTVYEVRDSDSQERIGLLYVDLHPRAGKRGGAWMMPMQARAYNSKGTLNIPYAGIVGNMTKPTKDTPSLLSFYEVETVFHEFGHALHQLLTECRYDSVSGTSVLWDFVELPSQIQENWLFHKETLDLFAEHYQTGEPIPESYVNAIKDTANFRAASFIMRQLNFCYLDMSFHTANPDDIDDVLEFEKDVLKPLTLMPYEDGSVAAAFSHIFAGGYSAGYYSYLWAEVLDADAFELFVEKGLYDQATGMAFRKSILARGASAKPDVLYREFRGRDADPAALLRKKGLDDKKAA